MTGIETFPTAEQLQEAMGRTPANMRPDAAPYAVFFEGLLSDAECDAIVEKLMLLEPYTVKHCGAVTRECQVDPVLWGLEAIARGFNTLYWDYDLDPGCVSWLQTYEKGGKYQAHMDGSPGQSRKLTAVLMLSDPKEYTGGDLRIVVPPKALWVPRARGTVVVFQPWMVHEVQPITSGLRQTINMGFWGPRFK